MGRSSSDGVVFLVLGRLSRYEWKSIEYKESSLRPSAYQPSALPPGQAGSHSCVTKKSPVLNTALKVVPPDVIER